MNGWMPAHLQSWHMDTQTVALSVYHKTLLVHWLKPVLTEFEKKKKKNFKDLDSAAIQKIHLKKNLFIINIC